jgi:hypothetical protein
MAIRLLMCALLLGLSGCADFKVAAEFGRQTAKMTGVVKDEFAQMEAQCRAQAELVAKTADMPDDAALDDCKRYQAAQGALAAATVDVLDDYAKALAAVADGKTFDLSPDLDGLGTRLDGLKDRAGNALIDARESNAIDKLTVALADAWAAKRREDAVRRLVAEVPDLALTGRVLKSYFVETADAPAGRSKAPYTNLVAIAASSVQSTEVLLRSPALRKAEPIRTYELRQELERREAFLRARGARFDRVGEVPLARARLVQTRIADAIDAWLAALDRFSADALSADPKALYDQLKLLGSKTLAARKAMAEF